MKQFYKILVYCIFIFSCNYSSASVFDNKSSNVERLAAPTATITADATSVCLNGTSPTITFTGSSGTAPYTFTYNIGSGSPQQISTTGTNTSVTITVPTGTAGNFIYTLQSVVDSTPTLITISKFTRLIKIIWY
jgi:hypothetical protein